MWVGKHVCEVCSPLYPVCSSLMLVFSIFPFSFYPFFFPVCSFLLLLVRYFFSQPSGLPRCSFPNLSSLVSSSVLCFIPLLFRRTACMQITAQSVEYIFIIFVGHYSVRWYLVQMGFPASGGLLQWSHTWKLTVEESFVLLSKLLSTNNKMERKRCRDAWDSRTHPQLQLELFYQESWQQLTLADKLHPELQLKLFIGIPTGNSWH